MSSRRDYCGGRCASRPCPTSTSPASSCTNCCRNWHVELLGDEPTRINSLKWPEANDPATANAVPKSVLLKRGGKTFLAHRADGSCVFLNLENGLCRIHEQFGLRAKPVGCQLYPFHLSPIFPDEVSVTARYDCPAVRNNVGPSHSQSLPELRELATKIDLGPPPGEFTLDHLERDQVQAIGEFISTLLGAFDDDRERALFINAVANWLATQNAGDVDRTALAKVFPVLRVYVLSQRDVKKPGLLQRAAFRTLLGLYLRRDEDVLDGRAGRLARLTGMLRLVFGGGNFRSLGTSYPTANLRRAELFVGATPLAGDASFALLWRFVRNQLTTNQYLGPANGGRDLVNGLRSLSLAFPLVLAAAKYSAASRNRESPSLQPRDIDVAVSAIAHSFGRHSRALQSVLSSLERTLCDPEAFARLARTV